MRRSTLLTTGLAVAGGFVGTTIAGCRSPGIGTTSSLVPNAASRNAARASLPGMIRKSSISPAAVQQIESIINAKGTVDNGVLGIEIDRNDITNCTLNGTPILPSFEINGDLYFQSIGGGDVMLNGDFALKTSEVDPFIDALIAHNLVFQAEHQHFYDLRPEVWFIHFRGTGSAQQVASGVKAALNVTSTPFPQAPPANPTTPLPAKQIGQILGGKPSIGANGVVTVNIPRAEPIVLGGIQINPYLNVSAPVSFQPLGGGSSCAAVPDYNMIASEINNVVRLMRGYGWDSGCLYNQETDEQPQLYFDHMFKTGDPIALAHQIRAGFNLMNVVCSS